ncbi:Holliday junction resolvase RuvX [Porphyromonas loveana]|uniref:Putative pre-16S rRNA nuclease n=1 Tax=Porphyromonas loveana TaxID=1884669 RepID=A0A2U1F291_9PORP|nr:Holliday junction resolvase RuvX [Porphyromonas loveana]PVZ06249.1 putative Holliday junction resolvase [Porphyromonas loveana]
MGRILAIDYGRKRTGIAVTDPLRIIPGGLATVPTHTLLNFLKDYVSREPVERFVLGLPRRMDYEESETMALIRPFAVKLAQVFPSIPITYVDERFTSRMAQRAILEAGIPKMKRRDKALVDEVSAVIILQSYLDNPER